MRIYLNNEAWRLKFCAVPPDIYGDCDYAKKIVRISKKLIGQDKLDLLLHELIHARFPDLQETSVSEFASELAGIIHAIGFREEWEFL